MSDAFRPLAPASKRPIGPRMAEALEFIKAHPGVTKVEVYRNCQGYPKPFGGSPNYLDRLLRRGLVYDLGRCNRAALYVWQEPDNDRPAGHWAPAHP